MGTLTKTLRRLWPVLSWRADVLGAAASLGLGCRVVWYGITVGRWSLGLLRVLDPAHHAAPADDDVPSSRRVA